ncbi:hypothetical protein MIDIC_110004 [Alphaproteobacteria bacterium]
MQVKKGVVVGVVTFCFLLMSANVFPIGSKLQVTPPLHKDGCGCGGGR